jgi:hypothetical protein
MEVEKNCVLVANRIQRGQIRIYGGIQVPYPVVFV